MKDYYIPDLTERYPEGLDGVDMFEPYDIEARLWDDLEREYRESERANIEQINRKGYTVIEQTGDGWTFAESDGVLALFTITGGQITSLYDIAIDRLDNRESMLETWREIASERD